MYFYFVFCSHVSNASNPIGGICMKYNQKGIGVTLMDFILCSNLLSLMSLAL